MTDDKGASIIAEANKQMVRAKRLIEQREESLRRRGINPDELRARAEAALRDDPEMRCRLDEAMRKVQRHIEQSRAHESFYAAAPVRRKAPRTMI